MKFRVKVGMHFENGEMIKEGKTFESNKPLHKVFPDKVELIQETYVSNVAPEKTDPATAPAKKKADEIKSTKGKAE